MFVGITAECESISTLNFVFSGFSLLFPSVCSLVPHSICLIAAAFDAAMTGSVSQRLRPQFCHVSLKPRAPTPIENIFYRFLSGPLQQGPEIVYLKQLCLKSGRKREKKYGILMFCFALITFCHPCSLCLPKYCSSDMSCHSATVCMSVFFLHLKH